MHMRELSTMCMMQNCGLAESADRDAGKVTDSKFYCNNCVSEVRQQQILS